MVYGAAAGLVCCGFVERSGGRFQRVGRGVWAGVVCCVLSVAGFVVGSSGVKRLGWCLCWSGLFVLVGFAASCAGAVVGFGEVVEADGLE